MHDSLHAAGLLTLLGVSAIVMAWNRAEFSKESFKRGCWTTLPFFVLGLLSVVLMNANGRPMFEWLLPLPFAFLAAAYGKRRYVRRALGIFLFLGSAALWFDHVELINSEFTSDPDFVQFRSVQRADMRVREVERAIRKSFHDEVLPEGYISDMIPNVPRFVEREEISRCWHTSFTGLFRVRRVAYQIWTPGGNADEAISHLTLRKSDMS